jgi:anaerobic magnesium-protoporphyrin IX monomethyl ester cyclase
MSRVALVYPYFRTRAPTELLFAPLGVAYLAAQLHEVGIEARIFDCTFSTFEDIQASLLTYHPDLVGIYCMITLSRSTFRIAEMLRAHLPGCLLVAGGPLPTLYPGHFLSPFDVVFRGEADLGFPRFCRDYFALEPVSPRILSNLSFAEYPGLCIHQDALQVDIPPIHHPEKVIDALPLPYRGDFDHAAYQQESLLKNGTKTTSIITTYGCPFDCDFCSRPVFGSLFRRRNIDSVMDEIEQIRRLGYDSLWIADDSFTLNLSYLKEFCLRTEGMHITWSCLSRVNQIDAEITHLMKVGGCRRVYLGLETGSQATLQLMNKKADLADGVNAVRHFYEAGLEVAAFFIVGYPGETLESIESTFKLSLTLPLDEISFNVPFPLPGSRLFERVSGLDTSKDWDKENEVTFVYSSEFDEVWLRRRINETLLAFDRAKKPVFHSP